MIHSGFSNLIHVTLERHHTYSYCRFANSNQISRYQEFSIARHFLLFFADTKLSQVLGRYADSPSVYIQRDTKLFAIYQYSRQNPSHLLRTESEGNTIRVQNSCCTVLPPQFDSNRLWRACSAILTSIPHIITAFLGEFHMSYSYTGYYE